METFYPAAVYYSGQTINPLHWDPNAYTVLQQILNSDSTATFIINETLKQQMESDGIDFKILENTASYYVISKE